MSEPMTEMVDTPTSDLSIFKELADAWRWKKRAEAEAEEAGRKFRELEAVALDKMVEEGVQRIRIDDLTLYLFRQIWARAARRDDESTDEARVRVCVALRKAGMGDFLTETFNVQTLSAHFREQARQTEWDDLTDLLGDDLRDAIALTEDYSIRGRRTG
jgi:hypothetical protein